MAESMTAMILCGGKGTRLRELTEVLPKPMVPIGEQPIVWHIMKCYAAFGVRHFILCLGYKREAFVDYFVNYHLRTSDATITLGHNPEMVFHGSSDESDWKVTLAGTGLDSMTGCRVYRAARYLPPDAKDFFLTYGDGLADIDLGALLEFHRSSGHALTLSAVRPEMRFGELKLDGGDVSGFEEKPSQGGSYINGGYMVLNREFVENYLRDDEELVLERSPMSCCAADGRMGAYRHDGFWQCMDNQREYELLNRIWSSGHAPWCKYWDRHHV